MLAFAFREASLRGLPLKVVHYVYDVRSALVGAPMVGSLSEDTEAHAVALCRVRSPATARTTPTCTVTVETLPGLLPEQGLVQLSRDADLTVVGTHQRGAVGRLLAGSVSESVLEHAMRTRRRGAHRRARAIMTQLVTRGLMHPGTSRASSAFGWSLVALAGLLVLNSLLGPLLLGVVDYPISASMTNQLLGLEVVTLVLVVPWTGLAGALASASGSARSAAGVGTDELRRLHVRPVRAWVPSTARTPGWSCSTSRSSRFPAGWP